MTSKMDWEIDRNRYEGHQALALARDAKIVERNLRGGPLRFSSSDYLCRAKISFVQCARITLERKGWRWKLVPPASARTASFS